MTTINYNYYHYHQLIFLNSAGKSVYGILQSFCAVRAKKWNDLMGRVFCRVRSCNSLRALNICWSLALWPFPWGSSKCADDWRTHHASPWLDVFWVKGCGVKRKFEISSHSHIEAATFNCSLTCFSACQQAGHWVGPFSVLEIRPL